MAVHQSSPETARPGDPRAEVEVYDCGCKIRVYQVEQGEWEGDPETRITVREIEPCARHNYNGHTVPPQDSRLVTVFGEHESYLDE